jgi:aspartokinase
LPTHTHPTIEIPTESPGIPEPAPSAAFDSTSISAPVVVDPAEEVIAENQLVVAIPESDPKNVVEEKHKDKIRTESEERETHHTRSFHIIVGSYRNRQNAKRMVRELRKEGIDAEMIKRGDSRILVTVFSATTEQEAEKQLPWFRSKVISSAWVFESSNKD